MEKDLELYDLIYRALCHIPNKRLGFEGAKDTYELATLLENRVKELTGQTPLELRRSKLAAKGWA